MARTDIPRTDTPRVIAARATLDMARQQHMLALQVALASGMDAAEIEHDTQAFTSAARQLVTLCTMPTGRGPALLGPMGSMVSPSLVMGSLD